VEVPNEVLTQIQTAPVSAVFVIDTDRTKYMKTKETAYVANRDIESMDKLLKGYIHLITYVQ
jgi:hypothetical protein